MLVYLDQTLNIMPSEHIEKPTKDINMFYKLFELFHIYVEAVNNKPQEDNREAKMLRREIESKQSPHTL
jgi:hypothetical protein